MRTVLSTWSYIVWKFIQCLILSSFCQMTKECWRWERRPTTVKLLRPLQQGFIPLYWEGNFLLLPSWLERYGFIRTIHLMIFITVPAFIKIWISLKKSCELQKNKKTNNIILHCPSFPVGGDKGSATWDAFYPVCVKLKLEEKSTELTVHATLLGNTAGYPRVSGWRWSVEHGSASHHWPRAVLLSPGSRPGLDLHSRGRPWRSDLRVMVFLY